MALLVSQAQQRFGNAGLLAVRILATADAALQQRMADFQDDLAAVVADKDAALRRKLLGE